MPQAQLQDTQVVRDPEVVALLLDGRRGRYFEPFLGRACTVSEAAASCGLRPNAMSYWVRKFGRLGMVRDSGPREERGRRVRTYRSVADQLVLLPPAAVSVPSEEYFRREWDPYWERFMRGAILTSLEVADVWAARLYRDEGGRLRREGFPRWYLDASVTPVSIVGANSWGTLHLTRPDAEALQGELDALFERYAARSSKGSDRTPYLLHLGLVKEPPTAPE
ncbi:hypothetical protein [Deinococcus aestuarii]|uniref:hypothetical protein n=1 Tax=Deinococcus aestuarii TaxID=2774531 RepID=UPI001C0AB932|nr:hypothetical protein [Deinococcus aestuarii]